MRPHDTGRRDSGPTRSHAHLRTLVLPLLLVAATPAPALQLIDARDGVAVEAILSSREPTRIRIEGAAIVDVFGNIHAGGCHAGATGTAPPQAHPSAEIVVECDRDKGEIYVRPMPTGEVVPGKPVNLFISSAHATYTLLLRRADTPADTIVLRDRTLRPTVGEGPRGSGPAPSHVRAMKGLLVAMASDRVPADVRVDEVQVPVRLWAEVRFTLMRRYEGRGLVGEKYLLQNVGATPVVLAEPEFDRPDGPDGGQVLGVAVEHHNLRPGETTSVFVIRRAGAP
jgi:conjugal transfer pilus assembly protein TraK